MMGHSHTISPVHNSWPAQLQSPQSRLPRRECDLVHQVSTADHPGHLSLASQEVDPWIQVLFSGATDLAKVIRSCYRKHATASIPLGIMVKCADRKKNIDLPRMELLELNLLPSICFVRFLIHPHRLVPCSECLMLDCAEGKVFFPRVWFLRKQLTVLNVHLF